MNDSKETELKPYALLRRRLAGLDLPPRERAESVFSQYCGEAMGLPAGNVSAIKGGMEEHFQDYEDKIVALTRSPDTAQELEAVCQDLDTCRAGLNCAENQITQLLKDKEELETALKLLLDYADEGTSEWRERFDKFFTLLDRLSPQEQKDKQS